MVQVDGVQAATSAGTARVEAPGLSEAREKAGAVPAKSVRRNGINGSEGKARTGTIFVPVLAYGVHKWTFSVPSNFPERFFSLFL